MTLDAFNALEFDAALSAMMDICGSEAWAVEMVTHRPYKSLDAFLEASDREWWRLGSFGWLEAFRAHPVTAESDAEPSEASPMGLLQHEYYATFGFPFVCCIKGKTPDQMCEAIKLRVENRPEEEMTNAAEEQAKITRHRIERLFAHEGN